MKAREWVIAGLLIAATVGFVPADEAIKCKWTPMAHGKWDFKKSSTFVLGDGTRINVQEKVAKKVVVQVGGRTTIEETTTVEKVTRGGADVTAAMGGKTTQKITATYDAFGEATNYRIAGKNGFTSPEETQAMAFAYPKTALRLNQTWTLVRKGIPPFAKTANRLTYRYLGPEDFKGTPVYRFSYSSVETTGLKKFSAKGVTLVAQSDGTVVWVEQDAVSTEKAASQVHADVRSKTTTLGQVGIAY